MTDSYPVAMPQSVQRVAIDTPGGPLAALDARPAQSPSFHGTAVMVPGFTGSKEDFIPLLAAVVSAGYRVVCFDQRGQYESAGSSRATAYSIEAFARDLSTVIDSVADTQPVHLLGHSFGGLVARRIVITRPEIVRSLTLLDSGPDGASLVRRHLLGVLTWIIRLGGPRVLAALTGRVGLQAGSSPDQLAWLRYRLLKSSRAGLIGICQATSIEPDLVGSLAATAIPVLVMCGENDDIWSPATQIDMAQRLVARIEVIKRAGHTPNEEQPDVVTRILLDFWAAVDSGH
jgi:pimeloyl-ACP methyl ester carboxylesterase